MMPSVVQVQCPAKVNLFLEVTGKRRDGYHTLATLFAKINLFDVVDAQMTPSGLELEIVNEIGQILSPGPDNLVLRAARAFFDQFSVKLGARLRLTKRVPLGAGLGGGSSDAAGTLKALLRLHNLESAPGVMPKLRKIALKLGADVPFFLGDHNFCEGRGVGERLTPLKPAKSLPYMILVFPGESISTQSVFKNFKLGPRGAVLTRLLDLDKLEKRLEKSRPISDWQGFLFNRLEEGVLAAHPQVRQAKDIMLRTGLQGVLMSGSGSSLFGFASSHSEGEKILGRLQAYPWKVFLTCCLG